MEDQTLDTGLNVRVAVSSTTPAQSLREAAAARTVAIRLQLDPNLFTDQRPESSSTSES